jgi:hypothetical protein
MRGWIDEVLVVEESTRADQSHPCRNAKSFNLLGQKKAHPPKGVGATERVPWG